MGRDRPPVRARAGPHPPAPPPRPPALQPASVLADVRIVLVAPKGVSNIGAVCRACANFEATQLVVVSPRCDVTDEHILTVRCAAAA